VRVTKYFSFFLYLPWPLPHADRALAKGGNHYTELLKRRADAEEIKRWSAATRRRAGRLARLDEEVGALLHYLQRLRLDQNTVIVLTSDTGPAHAEGFDPQRFGSTGPFRGARGQLWEGALRVPLIVRWPARIRPGTVSDRLCALWDLAPTALDIAQAEIPKGLDGISLLPTWTGQEQTNHHDYLYWEVHDGGFAQAIRQGRWKAVKLAPSEPLQLYDLQTDPAERHDQAAARPEIVARLERLLKSARRPSPLWPTQPKPPSPSAAHQPSQAATDPTPTLP